MVYADVPGVQNLAGASQPTLVPRAAMQLAGASGRSGLLVTLRAASKGGGRGGEEAAHSRRVAMRRMDVVSRRVVRKWAGVEEAKDVAEECQRENTSRKRCPQTPV